MWKDIGFFNEFKDECWVEFLCVNSIDNKFFFLLICEFQYVINFEIYKGIDSLVKRGKVFIKLLFLNKSVSSVGVKEIEFIFYYFLFEKDKNIEVGERGICNIGDKKY